MSWLQHSPQLWHKNPDRRASYSHGGGIGGFSRSGQSSLLQSVIRNLVDSVDEEERISQRSKLENDLEVASERLDALVQEHREKLHGTLDTFEKVDAKIQDSQDRIRALKTNLKSCKNLLRCKREELKRLWLEDVKYKHMLKMIDTIEEVQGLPERLKKYKQNKHYLHATELLNNNVARLEGELASVEALKDLKQELKQQKEHLHEELIDELHRHLYIKATARKTQHQLLLQHSSSPADSQLSSSPSSMRKTVSVNKHTRAHSRTLMEREQAVLTPPTIVEEDDDQVTEDLEVDPEENSSHYMAILIESLSILGKVQDALNAIQKRMEREFLLIIERASIQVSRIAEQEAGQRVGIKGGRRPRKVDIENQPRLLTKLLQICFERFRNVVSAHSVLLGHLQRTKRIYKRASFQLYEESDVWAAVQHALQTMLEVYLAFDEESCSHSGVAGFNGLPTSDVNAYFLTKKRAVSKVTKKPLFRFDSSRHAISIISYMREQRDLELVEAGAESVAIGNRHFSEDQPSISQHMVCKPDAMNITVVFGAVCEFVDEIEDALHLRPDENCQLYHFLHDFVEKTFLDLVRDKCADKLNSCAKPEAAKTVASDQRTLKMTGSKQIVLNSVLVVWQLVEELRQLMRDLPQYSPHFLSILCQLLHGYKESCIALYRDLTSVMPDGSKAERGMGQESVVSSKWARDEDINRMIRSLSNWMKLRQGKARSSEEENKQSVHAKESETLTVNLSSEPLRKSSVVLNHENLRLLAILHESLDWFNSCLKQAVMELTNHSHVGGAVGGTSSPTVMVTTDGGGMSIFAARGGVELDEDCIEQESQLSKIQFDFQTQAETTIIMLHLEVRCHCFYFLLPAVQKSSYLCDHESTEAEPAVRQLASDLKDIETVMVAVLSPEKHRYLFEGLGHLVASIFITSTQHLKTINSSGIKKMCRNISVLQSCLSKITLIREKDLDRARQYFEMLYLNDEEIFHQITGQARIFSQKDYTNALRLLAHSQPNFSEEKLEMRLKQLDTIFSKDAV